jgi:hypothetical protein
MQPFLIIEGCGTILSKRMTPAAQAILEGLTQVVQRIDEGVPVRYLDEADVTSGANAHYDPQLAP